MEVLVESGLKANDMQMLEATGFLTSGDGMYQSTGKEYDEGKFFDEMKMLQSRAVIGVKGQGGAKALLLGFNPGASNLI